MQTRIAPIVEVLKNIKENGPNSPESGLCYNVAGDLLEFYNTEVYKTWKATYSYVVPLWNEYTGDAMYPVPHPDMQPDRAYMESSELWEGEYGQARMRLVDFLIAHYSKFLTEDQV